MARTYSTPIELRFSDLDAYGHVNSALYFTYLETARVKLFSDFFREVSAQGIFTVVARAECDFKLPIMLYDTLIVTLWVAKTGRASFDIEYRLHDGGDITYATARTTMVCFDSFKKVTVPLPESIRAMA
ncbi:MAG TPA: acyl-CoA thioesterase [Desulfuromonadales bacterium]|nr:acyl-CoA thioesterase [Desulfuromonadales bacterium]